MKFRQKITLLIIVPCIVVASIIGYASIRKLKDFGVSMRMESLRSISTTFKAYLGDGEFKTKSGTEYFGKIKLDDMLKHMENLKNDNVSCTIFNNDTRVITTLDNEPIGTTASEDVINTVIVQGKEYGTFVNINGTYYCGYYVPLHNNKGNVVGMVFSGQSLAQMSGDLNTFIKFIIICIVVVMASCILTSLLILKHLLKPLVISRDMLMLIIKGDLSDSDIPKIKVSKDEIGAIYENVVRLRSGLVPIVIQIKSISRDLSNIVETLYVNSESVSKSTLDIDKAVNDVSQSATSQAEDAQQLTFASDDMGKMIDSVLQNIEHLVEISTEINIAKASSTKKLSELSESNKDTLDSITEIHNQIMITHKSVEEIKSVLEVITDITAQTNLLSLNASIEAAKAGDLGKGFSVVAMEIRRLAEQSDTSANNINTIIRELLSNFNKIIETMNGVESAINIQSNYLKDTITTFNELDVGISDTISGISDIETTSKDLEIQREKVVDIISSLSALSEENAATAEETSNSVQTLSTTIDSLTQQTEIINDSAKSLLDSVDRFKTE